MSTIRDLQEEIATACNEDDYLVQGGCKAVAEDRLDVFAAIEEQLNTRGGLAIVVSTLNVKLLGGATEGSIPCEVSELAIRTTETPASSRLAPGAITALQAAQHIMHMFHQPSIAFQRLVQTADEQTGTVSATVLFTTNIVLTDPAVQADPE